MDSHPIPGLSTSVAAFTGVFADGPKLQPVRVTSAEDARCRFGDADTETRRALDQFLINGGEDAWVVRADGDDLLAGVKALDAVDLVNILSVPDMRLLEPAEAGKILAAARDWCVLRRTFFIADAREGLTVTEMIRWTEHPAIAAAAGTNVAVYFPDLVLDGGRAVGPSGTMAGIYARTDKARGVWKAPAGIEATVAGAAALSVRITDRDVNLLTPKRVNCIRSLPAAGIVAWGARTMSENPEWKYVPVRRLMLFIEESIHRGLQWVVYEANGAPLWAAITTSVNDFLLTLWRQGALAGVKAQEAFFVRLTPSQLQGDLDIVIGFAPLRPAEFVDLHFKVHARDDEP